MVNQNKQQDDVHVVVNHPSKEVDHMRKQIAELQEELKKLSLPSGPAPPKDATLAPLKDANSHERDRHISFKEENHVYTVKGNSSFKSATKFLHEFFPKFDADLIIRRMMGKSPTESEVVTSPNSKYRGMSAPEIKAQWRENGQAAARHGTHLHSLIERYYNSQLQDLAESTAADEAESLPEEFTGSFRIFEEEVVHPRGWTPYRTEWSIYDEDYCIAGAVDMLYSISEKNDDELVICDWKRVGELKETSAWKKTGLAPVQHLPDTNYWHYALQLNLYRDILERCYGKRIAAMYLVALHPDNLRSKGGSGYVLKEVPRMEGEIGALLKARRVQLTGGQSPENPRTSGGASASSGGARASKNGGATRCDGGSGGKLLAAGQEILSFGKYRGLSFDAVAEQHPHYVEWAKGVQAPSDKLVAFIDFIQHRELQHRERQRLQNATKPENKTAAAASAQVQRPSHSSSYYRPLPNSYAIASPTAVSGTFEATTVTTASATASATAAREAQKVQQQVIMHDQAVQTQAQTQVQTPAQAQTQGSVGTKGDASETAASSASLPGYRSFPTQMQYCMQFFEEEGAADGR